MKFILKPLFTGKLKGTRNYWFLPLLLFFTILPAVVMSAAPQFSHEAGTFTEPFELTLNAGEGDQIYYTTNGDLPDQSSNLYDQPIQISGSMLVRVRVYSNGQPGEVVSKVYTQLSSELADFSSNLPLVIVHQFDEIMHPQGDYRTPAYFTVFDQGDDGRTRLNSENLHLQSRMQTNYRGTSSLSFPKKQFAVRFVDDDEENQNKPVLGMPSENNWIMHAPWDDRTLMRNAIAYQISRDMGRYAPRTRFVELFLHDGDGPVTESHYHGVYMLVERIKWDDNRVDIAKLRPHHTGEHEISGGYIINFEYGREWHISSPNRNTQFALVRPQDGDITHQQRTWIQNYLGGLESALFGSQFQDPENGYAAYMDPESFLDHHLITETFKEMDGYRLSTFLYKDRGGRLIMGPVWDYNLSLGNYTTTQGWNGHDPTGWYYTHVPEAMYLNGWYNRLFEDPGFTERYHERWWELRNGPFAKENFLGIIQEYVEKLDEAKERNFERWPILGEDVWEWSHEGFDTYEEEIEYMTNWITERLAWIDTQMNEPADDPDQPSLLYFWVFDNLMVNNTPLETINANYSLINQSFIEFHSALDGYPFHENHSNWRKASMERRNRPTSQNYRPEGNLGRPYEEGRLRAMQVRQPFTGDGGENRLIFHVPTTSIDGNFIFSFAAKDEGAADQLIVEYTTGSGDSGWTNNGLPESHFTLDDEFNTYTVDFSNAGDVSDNPHFRIRIRFAGGDMSEDDGNRVTFNNISFEADSINIETDVDETEDEIAHSFQISSVYPNPFNPSATIIYTMPRGDNLTMSVYNMIGQRVAVLYDGFKQGGVHTKQFDGSGLSSGIYILQMRAGDNIDYRKMTLIK